MEISVSDVRQMLSQSTEIQMIAELGRVFWGSSNFGCQL